MDSDNSPDPIGLSVQHLCDGLRKDGVTNVVREDQDAGVDAIDVPVKPFEITSVVRQDNPTLVRREAENRGVGHPSAC